LCCSSLPLDYSNARAVPVLTTTGQLERHTLRRVARTAQMYVDVMWADEPFQPRYAVVRVRLLHALVRHRVRAGSWPEERGLPINQEDLVYTYVSFTGTVLQGLERLGFRVSSAEAQRYLDRWQVVARALGLAAPIVPTSLVETQRLAQRLCDRHVGYSPQGRQLLTALVQMIDELLSEGEFKGFGTDLVEFFLDDAAKRALGIEAHTGSILAKSFLRALGLHRGKGPAAHQVRALRRLSLMVLEQLAARTPEFRMPDELVRMWR